MVDAVSASANSYRGVQGAFELRSPGIPVENRPEVAALASLVATPPITQVSASSAPADDADELGFLYAPNGQPGVSALPAYAVPPAQATTDERVTADRSPTARLAAQSIELDTLMSSFLSARTPAANPAPSPDVPAEAGNEQLSRTSAQQSVIAQFYHQF